MSAVLQTRREFLKVTAAAGGGTLIGMTFHVNQQGIVFQKDLGPETETAVASIEAYDPDESWHPTGD